MHMAMNQPTINTEVDDAVIPPSSTVDPTKLVDDNDDAFPSDIAEDGPVATPHFHKEMVYRVAIMSSQTELVVPRSTKRRGLSPRFLFFF